MRTTQPYAPAAKARVQSASAAAVSSPDWRPTIALALALPLAIDLIALKVGLQAATVAQYLAVAVAIGFRRSQFCLSLSVTFTILTPFTYLEGHPYLVYFSPQILLLIWWLIRSPIKRITQFEVAVWTCLLAYMTFLLFFGTSANLNRKAIWIALFVVILFASSVRPTRTDFRIVELSFLIAAALAAAFAIIEHLTHFNPLESIYSGGAQPLVQKWPQYRVFSTLGHPLVNGTLFAMAFGVVLALFTKSSRWHHVPLLILFGVACTTTASRTSLAASVAAALVCLLLALLRRNGRGAMRILGAVAVGLLAYLFISNPLRSRDGTVDGQGSSSLRDQYLRSLGSLMHTSDFLGTGVGGSSKAVSQLGGALNRYPIESSAVQILVAAGVIGSVLICLLLLLYIVRWTASGSYVGPTILITYVVAASGFNLFEAYPALLPLIPIVTIFGNGDRGEIEYPKAPSSLKLE